MKNDSSKRVVEVKNKKFTFGAIIIIVLSSLVFFGFQAFSEATYKYYSVNEILGSGSVDSNTQIGLKAVLVPKETKAKPIIAAPKRAFPIPPAPEITGTKCIVSCPIG